MRFPAHRSITSALAALVALAPTSASASCGLDQCPLDEAHADQPGATLHALTRVGVPAGTDGAWYSEAFLGARARLPGALRLGGSLPMIVLSTPEATVAGIGNAVVFVDWVVPLRSEVLSASLGGQVELPTSTREDLGEHHVALLPYARLGARSEAVDLAVAAGWGRSIEAGHSHGHDGEPLVNPHSESEILLRGQGAWSRAWDGTWLRLGPQADLIQELAAGGATLVTAGPFVEVGSGRTTLHLRGDLPVTDERRTRMRFGLSVDVALGAVHGVHGPESDLGVGVGVP